jgi:hypothetical protein
MMKQSYHFLRLKLCDTITVVWEQGIKKRLQFFHRNFREMIVAFGIIELGMVQLQNIEGKNSHSTKKVITVTLLVFYSRDTGFVHTYVRACMPFKNDSFSKSVRSEQCQNNVRTRSKQGQNKICQSNDGTRTEQGQIAQMSS